MSDAYLEENTPSPDFGSKVVVSEKAPFTPEDTWAEWDHFGIAAAWAIEVWFVRVT